MGGGHDMHGHNGGVKGFVSNLVGGGKGHGQYGQGYGYEHGGGGYGHGGYGHGYPPPAAGAYPPPHGAYPPAAYPPPQHSAPYGTCSAQIIERTPARHMGSYHTGHGGGGHHHGGYGGGKHKGGMFGGGKYSRNRAALYARPYVRTCTAADEEYANTVRYGTCGTRLE
nr:unnamed protein product [Digitaria exilis]